VTYILSKTAEPSLTRFLSSRVLLAFDFDGTLAPITTNPDDARMRRRTLGVLERVCRVYPCAVISGRRHADVLARLEGLPVRHVLGNHGAEPGPTPVGGAEGVAAVLDLLSRQLATMDDSGIEIEDKAYSVAVHYRRAENRRAARAAVERALAHVPPSFRVIAGKLVFDVVSNAAPHKGDALKGLLAAEQVEAAIYIGDDATDEEAFRTAGSATLLPIRVGRHRASAAPYFLRDQRELDLLLERIARARS
jgi:trehalose 6-phosphate phosphatase